jgi:hypothetical protein
MPELPNAHRHEVQNEKRHSNGRGNAFCEVLARYRQNRGDDYDCDYLENPQNPVPSAFHRITSLRFSQSDPAKHSLVWKNESPFDLVIINLEGDDSPVKLSSERVHATVVAPLPRTRDDFLPVCNFAGRDLKLVRLRLIVQMNCFRVRRTH